jgi:hypothetical protein
MNNKIIWHKKGLKDKTPKKTLKEQLDDQMKRYVEKNGLPSGYASYEELEREVYNIHYPSGEYK